MSWHGVNVELNIREATALEGHSREAIHLAAEVIADVTGYSRVELATLIAESIGAASGAARAGAAARSTAHGSDAAAGRTCSRSSRVPGCRWPTLKSWSGSPPDSRHHPESGGTLNPSGGRCRRSWAILRPCFRTQPPALPHRPRFVRFGCGPTLPGACR